MRLSPSVTVLALLSATSLACGDSSADPTTSDSSSTAQPSTGGPTTATPTTGASGDATTTPTSSDSDAGSGTMNASEATTGSTTGSTTEGTTSPVSATDTGTGETTDATTGTTGDTTGPACAPNVCSDDLTQVLCDGVVVEECGAELCVDGECAALSPCEAASVAKGSQGCEYWAVKTQLINEGDGSCFAVFVANTWSTPVKIGVEYKGAQLPVAQFARIPSGQGKNIVYEPYDANLGLPVGEVALLFLSRGPGNLPDCPAPAAVKAETHVPGNGFGDAFLITTDVPVSAYQMLPYGGGSVALTSATLMLPTSVWDNNYIGVNAYAQGQAGEPLLAIVADEDDTDVTIDPKVQIFGGGGVQGGPAGVPITYKLSRGQTMQIAQPSELTGSPIASTKPIGVFGGASCMNVPTNALFCEGAHQQLPPIKALGSAYAAVRYRDRIQGVVESPPWRLIGAVNDTKLTYFPAAPPGAPMTLALGQVAEFKAPGPFLVASQDIDHPFYFAGYMTGGADFQGRGDPEWVNIIPPAQYLKKYVFFTDPTYPETELVVVRNKVDGNFADVTLGCAGPLGGWQPLGPDQEWTRIDLVTGNFQDIGNCSNGRHEMSSDLPFGVTVWGWGSQATQGNPFTEHVSYAYPGGAAVKAINDVEVPPQ